MLSAFGLFMCVETDAVSIWFIVVYGDRWCHHLVYCCVWRQMLSAFGLLLCVETDGTTINQMVTPSVSIHNNKPNADSICLHTQQ